MSSEGFNVGRDAEPTARIEPMSQGQQRQEDFVGPPLQAEVKSADDIPNFDDVAEASPREAVQAIPEVRSASSL